jgi:hypothetical protein
VVGYTCAERFVYQAIRVSGVRRRCPKTQQNNESKKKKKKSHANKKNVSQLTSFVSIYKQHNDTKQLQKCNLIMLAIKQHFQIVSVVAALV